jgi:hypothetical protein
MIELKAVEAAYEEIHAANAAEPYNHAVYEAAWAKASAAAREYYGPILAEFADEVWLDCSEVWSGYILAQHYLERQRWELEEMAMRLNYEMGELGVTTSRALADELEARVNERWASMLKVANAMVEVEALTGPARPVKVWLDAAMLRAAWERLANHGIEL